MKDFIKLTRFFGSQDPVYIRKDSICAVTKYTGEDNIKKTTINYSVVSLSNENYFSVKESTEEILEMIEENKK